MPEFFVEIRNAAGTVAEDRPVVPALVDAAPVATLIFDVADRAIRYVNRALVDLSGRAVEELLALSVDELLRPAESVLTRPTSASDPDAGSTDRLTGEFVLYRSDGTRRYVEARTSGIEYHGVACGQVALWDVTERASWERQLLHRASHDTLTGLPNEWYASTYLHKELGRPTPGPQQMAVLFVDLNGFKQINDTFGHHVGDIVLQRAATRLKAAISTAELTARLHGDEFLVLCRVANAIHAAHLATRIRRSLDLPIRVGRHTVRVSASVGIAVSTGGAASASRLLRFADQRMYAEKRHPTSGARRRRPAS